MIGDLKKEVESGSAFSEALKRHPTLFDELYINLVESGEQAGVLDQVLADLADYKERVEAIKSKIKKALFYPIAVLAVAVIVSVILLLFVVPTFEELFQDFGADLPAFTQMVINLSEWLQANIGLTLLVIISIAVAFIQAKKRSYKFNHFMDRVSLKIPVLGKVLREAAIARFARTLATTFAAGVPLVDALDTVSGATGNIVFGEAVKKIRDDVAVGHQLQLAMAQTGVFPNMVVQMTAIGEESGALDKMLIKVAEYYEQEVNAAVDSLSSLMEPFIMVIIGGIVGSLVVAMYLPIFKLGAVV